MTSKKTSNGLIKMSYNVLTSPSLISKNLVIDIKKDPIRVFVGLYKTYKTPRAGFEPATNRLTVDRSTAELPRNIKRI